MRIDCYQQASFRNKTRGCPGSLVLYCFSVSKARGVVLEYPRLDPHVRTVAGSDIQVISIYGKWPMILMP